MGGKKFKNMFIEGKKYKKEPTPKSGCGFICSFCEHQGNENCKALLNSPHESNFSNKILSISLNDKKEYGEGFLEFCLKFCPRESLKFNFICVKIWIKNFIHRSKVINEYFLFSYDSSGKNHSSRQEFKFLQNHSQSQLNIIKERIDKDLMIISKNFFKINESAKNE